MSIVTAAQFSEFTGKDYSPAQVEAIGRFIAVAENWLRRACGYVFHNADDQGSDGPASQDWIEAVCLIVERLWFTQDDKTKGAQYSPFSTERLSDYSYTVTADRARDIASDPRIAQIIGTWRDALGEDGGGVVMMAVGPSREMTPEYDPDLRFGGGDVSRGALWGDGEP